MMAVAVLYLVGSRRATYDYNYDYDYDYDYYCYHLLL